MSKFQKLLCELSEIDSCDENTSDDDELFYINDEIKFGENAHKIAPFESK